MGLLNPVKITQISSLNHLVLFIRKMSTQSYIKENIAFVRGRIEVAAKKKQEQVLLFDMLNTN